MGKKLTDEQKAAKAAEKAAKAAAKAAGSEADTSYEGIVVGDPLLLRPVELPLVVKPADEEVGWANDAQAEYANILNAYAYKNPKKWEIKKDVLLKQLVGLAKDPSKLSVYTGIAADEGRLSYKNRVIEA